MRDVLFLPDGSPVAVTNFGLALPSGRPGRWRFICEESYGGSVATRYRLGPDGAVFSASSEGLFVSPSAGCSWARAGGALDPKLMIPFDVGFDPVTPRRMWAVATQVGMGRILSSTDGGTTFTETKVWSDATMRGLWVGGAGGEALTVVGGRVLPSRLVIETSDDGGDTWMERNPQNGFSGLSANLVGVTPSDGRIMFISLHTSPTTPDELWRSDDRGASARRVLTLSGTQAFAGFSFGANAGTVFVAGREPTSGGSSGPQSALYVSHDGGLSFGAPRDGPGFRCLGFNAGRLYACASDDKDAMDPFALGTSSDEGASWAPLFHFADVTGPPACLADKCKTAADYLCSTFFIACGEPPGGDDAGAADGGAADGEAADAPEGDDGGGGEAGDVHGDAAAAPRDAGGDAAGGGGGRGCSCALAGAPRGNPRWPVIAASFVTGGLCARRRRRAPRG